MGRKNSRPRLTLRKNSAKSRISKAQLLISQANSMQVESLDNLSRFKVFERNGMKLNITLSRVTDLDQDVKNWAFKLTEENMKKYYEESEWGWNPSAKQNELWNDTAWYLIARDLDGNLKAFVHFRFEVEEDKPVVYCYEIQVESDVQRRGVGKFLMEIIHLIGHAFKLKKTMLTVFKHNESAFFFYTQSLGFQVDKTSPSMSGEDHCYEILSKRISLKNSVKKKLDPINSKLKENGKIKQKIDREKKEVKNVTGENGMLKP